MPGDFISLAGNNELTGQIWESNSQLRIGRVAGLEILLDDPSISRRHAEICFVDKGWVIRDLGSTNGTFINGIRIGRVDRQIFQGDQLRFGNLTIVVRQVGEHGSEYSLVPDVRRLSQSAVQPPRNDVAQVDPKTGYVRISRQPAPTTLWKSSIGTMKDLLTSIVQEAAEVLEATTTFIAVKDSLCQRLIIRVGTGREIEQKRINSPMNLAEKTMVAGESLLFNSANSVEAAEERRSGASAICALVRNAAGSLGILQFQRSSDRVPYSLIDLLVADEMAKEAGERIQAMDCTLTQQQHLIVSSVIALAQAVELRDEYTGGHTQRVTDYALLLADEMELSEKDRYCLQVGTPLHDLGKIGIADAVLRKPGRLTPAEFETMKGHVVHGANIVETIPELNPILGIVRNHHERWDGAGYPDGLAGEHIPLLARLVAVVDVFDAMTSDRPYRPALSLDKAFQELRAGAGTQFDPQCVDAFCRLRPKIEKIISENSTGMNTTRPGEIARIRDELADRQTERRQASSLPVAEDELAIERLLHH
jgi:HD-GYP domain-containing protein (c-di-GMP phosphodiesterase class II)